MNDKVSCVVRGGGSTKVNGYYTADGGIYNRRGYKLYFLPDFFLLSSMHNYIGIHHDKISLLLRGLDWEIFSSFNKKVYYKNSPKDPAKFIFFPPSEGWVNGEFGELPSPEVLSCKGSLADAPRSIRQTESNLETLYHRPVTSLILVLICAVAFYLWSNRVGVSQVSFSYDKIMEGEYWRAITGSLSHFDAIHLGFNAMSLYQLGELEPVWGSVAFAYLNITLIVLTIAICIGMVHFLIKRYGLVDMGSQEAVGYSCVLFAWMVASSLRIKSYCPIFLMPTLCFNTIYVPVSLPGLRSASVPINFGPFALLLFTKFIIPRSSLMGHLSGIVIGYPLAWGLLDWITPPQLGTAIMLLYVWKNKLWIWRFPGYRIFPNLEEFVPLGQLQSYRTLRKLHWGVLALAPLLCFMFGIAEVAVRSMLCFLLWSAYNARRCEWMTEFRSVQSDCAWLILMALGAAVFTSLCDFASFFGILGAWVLLRESGNISDGWLSIGSVVMLTSACLETSLVLCLLRCLQGVATATQWMLLIRADAGSVDQDLRRLGVVGVATRAFSGQGRTLASGGRSAVQEGEAPSRQSRSAVGGSPVASPSMLSNGKHFSENPKISYVL